jgi:hypothetical protein
VQSMPPPAARPPSRRPSSTEDEICKDAGAAQQGGEGGQDLRAKLTRKRASGDEPSGESGRKLWERAFGKEPSGESGETWVTGALSVAQKKAQDLGERFF